MLSKIVVIIFLAVILYSLASAFYFMVRDKGQGDRTLQRLFWRVGLSLVLFVALFLMFKIGWIQPSGGPVNYRGG